MLKIVKGDISKSKEAYIVHQGNCKGVWGSGVAKALKEQFPEAFEDYVRHIHRHASLGDVIYYATMQVHGSVPTPITIVTILGQASYGRDGNRYTNYIALIGGLSAVFKYAQGDIAIPARIGCCRGGADWNIIKQTIEALAEDFKYDVYIYDYNIDDDIATISNLRSFMTENHKSITDLACTLNIPETIAGQIVDGACKPNKSMIEQIQEYIGK